MFRFRFVRGAAAVAFAALTISSGTSFAFGAWPLESGDTTCLGYGDSYVIDSRAVTHRGVDLAAESGAAILSPVDGEVSFVGRVPGASGTILAATIRTPQQLLVTLMPLESSILAPGQSVLSGGVVGRLAEAGDRSSAQTHLHVGVRRGETYIDPTGLLGVATTAVGPEVASTPAPAPATLAAPANPAPAPEVFQEPSAPDVSTSASGVESAGEPAVLSAQASPQVAPNGAPAPVASVSGDTSPRVAASPATPAPARMGDALTGARPATMRIPNVRRLRPPHLEAIPRARAFGTSSRMAGASMLLAAGLLALWPLWRRKGHLVPDVRPSIDDVAAAAAR